MKCESNLIIECPECGKSLGLENQINKSSYGMNLFSDGNCVGNYFNKEINIASCPICKSFFWITDTKQIGTKKNDPKISQNEPIITFPSLDDFQQIIKFKSLTNSLEKAKYIRTQIWQLQNLEIYRNNTEQTADYAENIKSLIKLITAQDEIDYLTLAELNRNIGNFDTCLSLLDKCKSENLKIFVRKIKKKAQIKDTRIFEIYD